MNKLQRKLFNRKQISRNSVYGGRSYPCWQKRITLKKRKPSTVNPLVMEDLIYARCYLPSLIKLSRRAKKIKSKDFQTFSYVQRRRYIRLLSFVQDYQPQKIFLKKKKIILNYPEPEKIYQKTLKFKPLDFDSFSYHFVKGGLLSNRLPSSHRLMPLARPYYEGGQPDPSHIRMLREKRRLKLKQKRVRRLIRNVSLKIAKRIKKVRRKSYIYRIFYRRQNKTLYKFYPNVKLKPYIKVKKDKNYLHTQQEPPIVSKFSRFWRVFKIHQASWQRFFLTTDVTFNLENSAKNLRTFFNRFRKRKEVSHVIDKPNIVYHRRHLPAQIKKNQNLNFLSKYYSLSSNRWRYSYRPVRQIDSIKTRWIWSIKHRGSFISGRHNFLILKNSRLSLLNYRLKMLQKKLYNLQLLKTKVQMWSRHVQVVHQRAKAKKLRSDRRRYFQRRLVRLRRNFEKIPTLENYYSYSSCHTCAFYRVNRFSTMELNNTVREESTFKYYIKEQKIRDKVYNPRFFFSLYYNYFIRTARPLLLQGWRKDWRRRYETKTGETRMKPIKDHPTWGPHFNKERERRFSFLRKNLLTRLSRKFSFKNYKKVPVEFINASIYIQKVDTRRKLDGPEPVDRSLMSFFLAFVSGLSVEKNQKKTFPATIAALLSFNRLTLNLETVFAPVRGKLKKVVQKQIIVEEVEQKVQVMPPRPSIWRKLAYYCWFYFFTPVWYVYYFVARFYAWLIKRVVYFFEDVYDNFRACFRFHKKLFTATFIDPLTFIMDKIQGLRVVRLLIWVYTSWLHVDALENDHYEKDYAPYDEFDHLDLEADQDMDPDTDRPEMEEDDDTGLGYSYNDAQYLSPSILFFHSNPTWEWYQQNIPDEEIEELFDETSYFVRLFFRPFVDFVVRLPFWAILELISLWLEVIKGEYHRIWYKIITYKNTKDKVSGRWWKIPLILTKVSIRLTIWGSFFFWLVNLIKSEDLKIIVTYNLGVPWFEEYYYFYVAFCFFISVYLVGPLSLRDFCFKELGFENLIYIFVIPASVSRPESYQPQRSSWKTYQYLTRGDLNYGEKEPLVGYDYLSGRFHNQAIPHKIFSYDDIRIVLAQFNEFDRPLGVASLDYSYVVSLHDRPTMGEKSNYRFSERHPSDLKNDWYRRDKFDYHPVWTFGHLLSTEDNHYISAHSGDQYWNRVIVNRMEYPQNLKESFNERR